MAIKLGFGMNYENLYETNNLVQLDNIFLSYLKEQSEELYQYLISNRETYKNYSQEYGQKDNEIIVIAKYVEEFLLQLFPIMENYQQLQNRVSQANKVFLFRKLFINKYVKNVDYDSLNTISFNSLENSFYQLLNIASFNEDKIIATILFWLDDKDKYSKELEIATNFIAFIFYDDSLKAKYKVNTLFFKAKKYNFEELIPLKSSSCTNKNGYSGKVLDSDTILSRDDFSFYKDSSLQQSMHHSNYCVKCHARGKDNCRLGDKKNENYVENPLQVSLQGCPLGMHISQMHCLNESNNLIAALVAITINNPLCAATGNNICYDCVNSCIFQKQERVNTPLVETHILKEVLKLPWGFEIYNLLTLWNPLRVYRPYPKVNSDYNILVVGSGPAGYSLAYNLLQEGHGVVVVDALKIEPLKQDVKAAIVDIKAIFENLDERVISGFGGVSEYGITTRWDKNYLTILQIILARHSNFYLQGSIKFGTNLTIDDAKELGFHHVALCVGAGDPNLLKIENLDVKGIKTASEFLMTLHLGAFRKNYLHAMQVQLPIVVLGAGLTAVDVATEVMVYYKRQVVKFVEIYQELLQQHSYAEIVKDFTAQDKEVLNEYLQFYEIIKQAQSDKSINLTQEIIKRGGVKIVYHKSLVESKAYRNNHEELQSALKQGVEFIENMQLQKIIVDEAKNLTALEFENQGKIIKIEAKTLVLALGTNPNKIFMQDMSDYFNKQDNNLQPAREYTFSYKGQDTSLHLKQLKNGIFISILGDLHNVFNGSVVKAIASSLHGYNSINHSLEDSFKNSILIKQSFQSLLTKVKSYLKVTLVDSKIINNKMIELSFKGEAIYNNFKAGMFYKLQNYEKNSGYIANSKLNFKEVIEPLFLSAIKDESTKTIKTIILKSGLSSTLANSFNKNNAKNLVLMGPLGSPSKIMSNGNLLLIGGGVANVATMAILAEAKSKGNKIIYIAGYKKFEDILYLDILHRYADNIFLCIEEDFDVSKFTKQSNFHPMQGNVLGALDSLSTLAKASTSAFTLDKLNEVFIAGSSIMMAHVKEYLIKMKINSKAYASLNAPMQCGLGGVCASCLQSKIIDGKKVWFYACQSQDQNINIINFNNLSDKLKQNFLQEKLSANLLMVK